MRLSTLALAVLATALGGASGATKAGRAPAKSLVCIPTMSSRTTLCTASSVVLVNEKSIFTVDVPAGMGSLTVRLTPSGGKGDADLDVVPPASSSAEPKSSRESKGPDTVTYPSPPPGTYTITVSGFGDETAFLTEVEFGKEALPVAAAPAHASAKKLAPLHGDPVDEGDAKKSDDDKAPTSDVDADADRPHTFPSATRNRASGGKLVRPKADDDEEAGADAGAGRGDGADVDRADDDKRSADVDGDRKNAKDDKKDEDEDEKKGAADRKKDDGDDDDDGGKDKEKKKPRDDDDDGDKKTAKVFPVPGRGDPHLVRPGDADEKKKSDNDDDDDDHGDRRHDTRIPAKAHDHDDDDHHHHAHSGSFLTKALSILTALGAAFATLWAARTGLPSVVAGVLARRWAPASVPLAGLGAFDDAYADAEPLDASGMEMGGWSAGARPKGPPPPGGGGAPAAGAPGRPVFEMKARAGGVPAGPVIDAAGGGGIGAYRPPQAPAAAAAEEEEEMEEGGAGRQNQPAPPPEDPFR